MDTYKSVSELIKNLPGDEQLKNLLENEIKGYNMYNYIVPYSRIIYE